MSLLQIARACRATIYPELHARAGEFADAMFECLLGCREHVKGMTQKIESEHLIDAEVAVSKIAVGSHRRSFHYVLFSVNADAPGLLTIDKRRDLVKKINKAKLTTLTTKTREREADRMEDMKENCMKQWEKLVAKELGEDVTSQLLKEYTFQSERSQEIFQQVKKVTAKDDLVELVRSDPWQDSFASRDERSRNELNYRNKTRLLRLMRNYKVKKPESAEIDDLREALERKAKELEKEREKEMCVAEEDGALPPKINYESFLSWFLTQKEAHKKKAFDVDKDDVSKGIKSLFTGKDNMDGGSKTAEQILDLDNQALSLFKKKFQRHVLGVLNTKLSEEIGAEDRYANVAGVLYHEDYSGFSQTSDAISGEDTVYRGLDIHEHELTLSTTASSTVKRRPDSTESQENINDVQLANSETPDGAAKENVPEPEAEETKDAGGGTVVANESAGIESAAAVVDAPEAIAEEDFDRHGGATTKDEAREKICALCQFPNLKPNAFAKYVLEPLSRKQAGSEQQTEDAKKSKEMRNFYSCEKCAVDESKCFDVCEKCWKLQDVDRKQRFLNLAIHRHTLYRTRIKTTPSTALISDVRATPNDSWKCAVCQKMGKNGEELKDSNLPALIRKQPIEAPFHCNECVDEPFDMCHECWGQAGSLRRCRTDIYSQLDLSADGSRSGQKICLVVEVKKDVKTPVHTIRDFLDEDSRSILCGGRGSLRLWDVPGLTDDTPPDCIFLEGHDDHANITDCDFAPENDSRVISCGSDRSICLWNDVSQPVDAPSRVLLCATRVTTATIHRQVVLSPNAQRALSLSEDGCLNVWDISQSGRYEDCLPLRSYSLPVDKDADHSNHSITLDAIHPMLAVGVGESLEFLLDPAGWWLVGTKFSAMEFYSPARSYLFYTKLRLRHSTSYPFHWCSMTARLALVGCC
eukprot:SAG11_NODE_238_length_11818_cov_2.367693_5_plen_924_part_00